MEDIPSDASRRIQYALENAISSSLETAKWEAANDPFLGHPARRRSDDYYAFVALHRLFLIACGADMETQTGGNVKTASKILHVGGKIARGWQKEDVNSHDIKLPETPGSADKDLKNRQELRQSAERLVRDAITKALVEHVSKEDADLRTRFSLAIEARIPKDDSGSERAEMFSAFVRSFTDYLLGK